MTGKQECAIGIFKKADLSCAFWEGFLCGDDGVVALRLGLCGLTFLAQGASLTGGVAWGTNEGAELHHCLVEVSRRVNGVNEGA